MALTISYRLVKDTTHVLRDRTTADLLNADDE